MSFFSTKNEDLTLLVDIGNGNINGALVSFVKNKKPKVLYTTQVPFVVTETPNAGKLVEDMYLLLDLMLHTIIENAWGSEYFKNHSKKVSKALVTFSSPWFVLKTKHINLSEEKPFVITKSFVDNITEKEEEIFQKELMSQEPADTQDSFEVIEKSIVHTRINGYTLDQSIGKKTKNFDAYLCLAVVSRNILNKVRSIIFEHMSIHPEDILLHTFPLVSFTTIRDIFHTNSDFIMIDVTGEVTDITLVKSDVVAQSVSMPSGKNFILRQIIKTLAVTPEIAESTLSLYSAKKLDDSLNAQMDEILLNTEKEWSIYLENSLLELAPEMTLPGNVYLTADDDVAPFYIDFLKLSKTDSTGNFRKNLNLIHINGNSLQSFYETTPAVQVNEFLAILIFFYNKFQ